MAVIVVEITTFFPSQRKGIKPAAKSQYFINGITRYSDTKFISCLSSVQTAIPSLYSGHRYFESPEANIPPPTCLPRVLQSWARLALQVILVFSSVQPKHSLATLINKRKWGSGLLKTVVLLTKKNAKKC